MKIAEDLIRESTGVFITVAPQTKLIKAVEIMVENKTGALPEDTLALAEWLNSCEYLKLNGLMTMGPLTGDPELSRPYYRETRRLFEEITGMHLKNATMEMLSMGMSADFEKAIAFGATHLRVGSAIFGDRVYT